MKAYCHTNDEAMVIGERARRLAAKRGVRNKVIAQRLGILQSDVSRIWLGAGLISGVRLIKICKALECSPNELLGWEDMNDKS